MGSEGSCPRPTASGRRALPTLLSRMTIPGGPQVHYRVRRISSVSVRAWDCSRLASWLDRKLSWTPSATRWADPCWAVQPICPDRHCWDSWPVLPWSVAKPSVRSAVSRRSSAFRGRRTGRTRPCRGGMGSGLYRRCINFVPVRPDAAALAALPRLPAALRARRCTSDAVERNLNRLRRSESRDSSFVYGSPPRGMRIID